MSGKQIDSEKLILWIEGIKQQCYEYLGLEAGHENPEVIVRHMNNIMGRQFAYDNVIHHIRELQGSDDE